MALASVFYDGPSTETDRAMYRAGAPDYGVIGPDDFRVSAHPSIPYALLVKAGEAHGHGVTDTPAMPGEDQLVQCAPLSGGGAVRWDLVVVRRNWQPLLGGPSTLVVIQGGTTAPNIQTIRKIGPGVEDDQPLALVEWRGGVNTPKSIIDLRCWAGNGGIIAVDKLALSYLAKPGADVLIAGTTWRYALGANGVWSWTTMPDATTQDPGLMSSADKKKLNNTRVSAAGTRGLGPVTAGGTATNQTINFPTGRFTAAPAVTISPGNSRLSVGISSVTAGRVIFSVSNWTGAATGNTTLHWIASQP